MDTLDEIGRKYGSDKSSQGSEPWMWSMGYLDRYDELLTGWRDEPITLLELGYGEYDPVRRDHSNPDNGGRSARMWRDYFSKASINVVDIVAKRNIPEGVNFFCGSQDDPDFLHQVVKQTGPPDVIIDDASHVSSLTVASFKILWPHLRPHGLYLVEDLHSAFHPWFYGDDEACENPNTHATTAMSFFKRMADEAFFRGTKQHGPKVDGSRTEWDCFPRKYWLGYEIDTISFCHPQLIVIRKR